MFTTTLNRLRRRHNDGPSRRGDDSGLTLSEPIIVILLIVIFGALAAAAIVFFQRQGQTTVARANLESAILAAETAHNFSPNTSLVDDAFAIGRMQPVVPDLAFRAHAATPAAGPPVVGNNGATGLHQTLCTPSGADCAPGPQDVFVEVSGTTITRNLGADATFGTEQVAAGDAVVLQVRAENGDTYCAVAVLESRIVPGSAALPAGATTELLGTRYGGAGETATAAGCGAGAALTAADVLALTREIPDLG